MLRFVITVIISLLISFGAIAKSQKVSSLMNHVIQDHVSHSHDGHDKSHHHHHHKHSHTEDKEHSHHFDFSVLTQVFTVDNYPSDGVISPLSFSEALAPLAKTSLSLSGYSFSIFRPPIA